MAEEKKYMKGCLLTDPQWEAAKALGDGNASKGIRRALEFFHENVTVLDIKQFIRQHKDLIEDKSSEAMIAAHNCYREWSKGQLKTPVSFVVFIGTILELRRKA